MRRNPITRIVVYSVLIMVLSCILVSGICAEFLMAQLATSDNVPTEGYASGSLHRLQIHWNGGNVTIRQGKGDGFSFYETKPDGCWYRMESECEDDTLSIHYSESDLSLTGLPEKDLVVQVPENWGGEEIQIHATGSVISIENIDVNRLRLSGTGYEVYYSGAVMQLDAKGTGTKLTLNCTNRPNAINFDGIGSTIQLKLPENCGFSVETGGIGCHVTTDLTLKDKDGKQTFGNGECAIFIKGIGSSIHIANSGKCAHVWTEGLFPTGPDQNILIYTCTICGITKTEPDNHEHLWKDISETPEHPNFICSICGVARLEPKPELTLRNQATVISGFMGLVGIRANGSIIQHNPTGENPVPEIDSWTNMRSLASGNAHIVGLRSDGTVVAAGDNSYGQCNVSNWTDVVSIDCGTYFTVGLKADGTVLHTGAAPYGIDNVKNWVDIVQLEAAGERVLGRTIYGSAVALGDPNNEMCQVPSKCDIKDIYLDTERAVYLHSDGKIEIKGNRLYVEDQTNTSLTTVETDGIYLAGLKNDGSMHFEGYNADLTNKGQIVAIVDYCLHKLGLRSDGTLVVICKYGGTETEIPSWVGLMMP